MYKNLYNILLAVVGLIAMVLGVWGFSRAGRPPGDWLVGTLNLIRGSHEYSFGQDPWQLVVAQFAVPAVAVLAMVRVFLAGLRRDLRVALARRKRNHAIVCGLGEIGMQVVRNLQSEGHDVVAIDLDSDSAQAAGCERGGVPVLKGDAKDPQVLRVAGIGRARVVILSTGNDAENLDVALRMEKLAAGRKAFRRHKLQVLAELRSDWLFSKMANHDKQLLTGDTLDLRFFNTYSTAARMLVKALRLPPAPELSATTFAIVGFGHLGREAALHLLRAAPVPLGRKLKLVVFDRNAAALQKEFLDCCPVAGEVAEVRFVAADLQLNTAHVRHVVAHELQSEPLLGVAVCIPDDDISLYVALEVRALLDSIGHLSAGVFARLEQYKRLGDFTGDIEQIAHFSNRLRVFDTLEEMLSLDVLLGSRLDALAQSLHDDYRQRPHKNPRADVPFSQLPEFMKMSNRWRADHIPIMLALAGFRVQEGTAASAVQEFTQAETEALARLEHRRFSIERRLLGWEQGEGRDVSARRHPHLVDWDELDEQQRAWNRHEVARLPQILGSLGLSIIREQLIRAYGPELPAAAAEVERRAAHADGDYCVVIVDLDQPEAVEVATRALALPEMGLWLISQNVPREFFERATAAGTAQLFARSEGWMQRQRLASEILARATQA